MPLLKECLYRRNPLNAQWQESVLQYQQRWNCSINQLFSEGTSLVTGASLGCGKIKMLADVALAADPVGCFPRSHKIP
jgi:hypothetical protein